jgi:hypothetical protein
MAGVRTHRRPKKKQKTAIVSPDAVEVVDEEDDHDDINQMATNHKKSLLNGYYSRQMIGGKSERQLSSITKWLKLL